MKELKSNEVFQTSNDKICVKVSDLPAHLFYSADGVVYTQWKDAIVDSNVVVSNIPLGTFMYIDQDSIITD